MLAFTNAYPLGINVGSATPKPHDPEIDRVWTIAETSQPDPDIESADDSIFLPADL